MERTNTSKLATLLLSRYSLPDIAENNLIFCEAIGWLKGIITLAPAYETDAIRIARILLATKEHDISKADFIRMMEDLK